MTHHDFEHSFRVAQVSFDIARDEWPDDPRTAELAGIAGLLHSADRILEVGLDKKRREIPEERVKELLDEWVGDDSDLSAEDITVIYDAVFRHDGPNADDSRVLMALQEADRVVNLDPDGMLRSAQHYAELPVLSYVYLDKDPTASYKDVKTVLRDIAESLFWVKEGGAFCNRTRLGLKLATENAWFIQEFIRRLDQRLCAERIRPYPFA